MNAPYFSNLNYKKNIFWIFVDNIRLAYWYRGALWMQIKTSDNTLLLWIVYLITTTTVEDLAWVLPARLALLLAAALAVSKVMLVVVVALALDLVVVVVVTMLALGLLWLVGRVMVTLAAGRLVWLGLVQGILLATAALRIFLWAKLVRMRVTLIWMLLMRVWVRLFGRVAVALQALKASELAELLLLWWAALVALIRAF